MGKVLYIEDHPDLHEIFSPKLESLLGLEILGCGSYKQALELLKGNRSDIDVVIADFYAEDADATYLFNYIRDENYKIPMIVMDKNIEGMKMQIPHIKEIHPSSSYLAKPPSDEDLNEALRFLIGRKEEKPKDYHPIKLEILYKSKQTPTDIFIKLTEKKYVHLYHKGEKLKPEDIEKYKKKEVENVYIRHDEIDSFLNYYLDLVKVEIEKLESGSRSLKSLDLLMEGHEVIHKQMHEIGLTQESIELSKLSVSTCIHQLKGCSDLVKLLENLQGRGGYPYEHSMMLACITYQILEEIKWNSKDTLFKLNLACLYHDISLFDPQYLKDMELNPPQILPEEMKARFGDYFHHPTRSAEQIFQFREVPPDTQSIISQHHERPDGSGFPNGLKAARTFPLACVLIVAEVFLNKIQVQGFNQQEVRKVLFEMEGRYGLGHYAKPFFALKDSLTKKN